MVELLQEDIVEKTFNIQELKELIDTGWNLAEKAQRPLKEKHAESLAESDENSWPPILVTKTDIGYVLVDGRHRRQAMRLKKKQQIRAEVRTFDTTAHVLEAAFEANMAHGLRADNESRSNYAWFLHVSYPNMEQIEIARRACISQPVVSRVIKREEARLKAEEKKKDKPEQEPEDPHKVKIRTECHRLTQDALKLFEEISDLSEQERQSAIAESIQTVQDREALYTVAQTLVAVLKPRTARMTHKKEATPVG